MTAIAPKSSWLGLQPCGFGKAPLAVVEGKESFRTAFQSDGNVQQIDRALSVIGSVFGTQVVRPAEHIRPAHRGMNKQPFTQILLDLQKRRLLFLLRDLAAGGDIAAARCVLRCDAME